MSVNKIILIGNLGKKPELSYAGSGTAVCKFSVATSKKSKGEDVTTWHNVACFKNTAENVAKYLIGGSTVYLEGEQTHRKYEKDGQTKYFSEVVAYTVQFLSGKNPEKNEEGETKQIEETFTADDIPF